MEKVNYIAHLNGAFERFNNDYRIRQGHITLYLAFFQKWNRKFFKRTIMVNRQLIMENAKIRSKTTYHNYLKELNEWGYLEYFPSYHPSIGSRIRMTNFGTSTGASSGATRVQKMDGRVPEPGHGLVPFLKQKTKKNFYKLARPNNEIEVLNFFRKNNWPDIEGKKFYAYYQSKNWKLGRGLKIKDWKAAAKSYVKLGYIMKEEFRSPISGFMDHLRSPKPNNYDEPL